MNKVLHRHARIGFFQKSDDLLFAESLLNVQSPLSGGLDSKRRRYSKIGGCRVQTLGRSRALWNVKGHAALSSLSDKLGHPLSD